MGSVNDFSSLAQDANLRSHFTFKMPLLSNRFAALSNCVDILFEFVSNEYVIRAGESGLGKSTLINSMFLTDLYSPEYPGPTARARKTVQVSIFPF